nr:hypothetical protein CcurKRNrm1_p005 [Cryptomonas curvata]
MFVKLKKCKLFFRYYKEELLFNLIKKRKKTSKIYRKYTIYNKFNKNEMYNKFDISSLKFLLKKEFPFFVYNCFFKSLSLIFVPIFNIKWAYQEEIILFEAIEKHGFSNWEKISQCLGSKNLLECEKHFLEIIKPYSNKNFFEINRLFSNFKKEQPKYKNFRNMLKISNFKIKCKFLNNYYCEKFITDLNFTKNLTGNFIITIKKINFKRKNNIRNILSILFNKICYKNLTSRHFCCYTNKLIKNSLDLNNKQKNKKCNIYLKKKNGIYKKKKNVKIKFLYKNQKFNKLLYRTFTKWLKLSIKFTLRKKKYYQMICEAIKSSKKVIFKDYQYIDSNREQKIYNNIFCKKDKLLLVYFGLSIVLFARILWQFILDKGNYSEDIFLDNIQVNFQNLLFLFDQFLIEYINSI